MPKQVAIRTNSPLGRTTRTSQPKLAEDKAATRAQAAATVPCVAALVTPSVWSRKGPWMLGMNMPMVRATAVR
jgi:hypothetical protein